MSSMEVPLSRVLNPGGELYRGAAVQGAEVGVPLSRVLNPGDELHGGATVQCDEVGVSLSIVLNPSGESNFHIPDWTLEVKRFFRSMLDTWNQAHLILNVSNTIYTAILGTLGTSGQGHFQLPKFGVKAGTYCKGMC